MQNYKFSEERADSFCAENDLLTIIRSGEPLMEGFEVRESLISVFSCSDYGGQGNKLSVITVKKNEHIDPLVLNPQTNGRNRWMQDEKKKPINQEDALLRSLTFTPPK